MAPGDEDADMPLPPEARFEVAGPVAAAAAPAVSEAGPVGLEDFFGSSHASSNQDNVSLLDLSMAANQVPKNLPNRCWRKKLFNLKICRYL